jgi:hypothetical protein
MECPGQGAAKPPDLARPCAGTLFTTMPSPFDSHLWWFPVIVLTVIVLVAWISVGSWYLERHYGDEINPGG